MKTCHVCGTQVEDKELICPVCGATVVKATSGMSLKVVDEGPKKKKSPSIGTTVSTGSGYTDILRREDDDGYEDDDYINGSIPMSYTKLFIEDDGEHKKVKDKRFIKSLSKLIFIALAAFVGYLLVAKFFLKTDKTADSYDAALDMYVEAVNSGSASDMKLIVPKYQSDRLDEAEFWLRDTEGVTITSYSVKDKEDLSQKEINDMFEDIKARTSKTANIKEGVVLTVEMSVKIDNALQPADKKVRASMTFIKIEGAWYLYYEDYSNPSLGIN